MKYNFVADQKFVTLAVDIFIGLVLYFAGKYASSSLFDDIKTVFLALQPLIALWIAGMFQADQASLAAGNTPKHLR